MRMLECGPNMGRAQTRPILRLIRSSGAHSSRASELGAVKRVRRRGWPRAEHRFAPTVDRHLAAHRVSARPGQAARPSHLRHPGEPVRRGGGGVHQPRRPPVARTRSWARSRWRARPPKWRRRLSLHLARGCAAPALLSPRKIIHHRVAVGQRPDHQRGCSGPTSQCPAPRRNSAC